MCQVTARRANQAHFYSIFILHKTASFPFSIPAEQVPCVYFFFHIIQTLVISVCDDGVAQFFELLQIVNHDSSKKLLPIFQGRLIDNHRGVFHLYALHDALNAALAEVIKITLHGQPEYSDDHILLMMLIPLITFAVSVVPCKARSTRSAMKSFLVLLLSTMADIIFRGTSA